jgi:2-methylcitrate dehydratase PrpD
MMAGMTEGMTNFIIKTEYSNILEEAVTIAKNSITDGLGVALAATHEPAGIILSEYSKEMGRG